MRLMLAVLLVLFTLATAVLAEPHVVIVTIDGFPAYLMNDKAAPIPTLRKLAAEGVVAEGMRPVNPSVTWPNHTTLISGVKPEKHSCFFNGVLMRPGPGMPVSVDPKRDAAELVAVPTLPDVLHKAGLRTAAINWPCTRNSPAYEDNFPDSPEQVRWMTPRLREEMVAMGALPDATDKTWGPLSGAMKDQIWTAAACHVIKARKPNLLVFHLLVTDGLHHKYGPQTPAGYAAVGMADDHVNDLLEALDAAGIRKDTTIFIVADHGFETASKIIQPNVLLKKEGLLKAALLKIASARVQSISEGGIAMVYLTNPETYSQDREKVVALFKDAEGIESVILPEKFAELGLPLPSKNPQMADLILSAKPGYAFGNAATGDDLVIPAVINLHNVGHHGYLSTNPKMNAVFIAQGPAVKKGGKIGVIDNIDVAPTAAHLLGVKLPEAQGKLLSEILIEAK
jgi:predicted AlkP superfamily pyrophosphatase or phosphodiesterase